MKNSSQNLQKEILHNLLIYSFLLLIALIGITYGQSIKNNYKFLRVWEYSNLLLLLIGLPFLFVQNQARLPNFLASDVSNKKRFLIPFFIGAVFGILDILVVKVLMHPEPYTELPAFLQPFPYSIFLYLSGAFEIEVFYRLIPLTILLFAADRFAKGKRYLIALGAALVLTSLREPLEQLPDDGWAFITYSFITGFFMNFVQAFYYHKAGFLASLTLRLGHYFFWHILLGIFVQYFEIP